MGPSQAEREIQQLRDEIRLQAAAREVAENEAHRARHELSILQSSLSQSQTQPPPSSSPPSSLSSSPSNPSIPSHTYHGFKPSSVPHTTNPFQQQDAFSRRHSMQQSISRTASHGQSSPTSRHYLPSLPSSSARHNISQHGVKRQRTQSQQDPAAHQMNRSHSNLSTRSAGPFSGDAPVSPLSKANSSNSQANGGMLDCTNTDEQAQAYTAGHAMNRSQSTMMRRRSDLMNMPTVTESVLTDLMDPGMFFAMQDADNAVSPYLSSDISQFNMSNMSACGSMTSAPTLETADMTRQNSNTFDSQSVGHGMDMLKLGSQQGIDMSQLDSPLHCYVTRCDSSPLGKRTASSEEDLMAVGSSLAPPFPHPYATSAPADGLLMSQDMSRSASNTSMASTRSSSSLKARAKESLQRQNMRSINTPLKPKPSVDHKAAESQPSAKKDGKTAISKAKYVRPRQPKVHCEQCDEHKDGFRGEHELRRHRDAKHPDQGVVKKWICIDPTTAGLPISIPVVNSLEKCKACKAGKKYGAYYNAAAHLRRTHFKEKPSRAKKNAGGSGNRGDDDKRGGKGGGDWPPMPELKNWMQEVLVRKDELRPEDEENEDDGPTERGPSEMDLDLEHNLIPLHHGYSLPADNSPDNMMSEIDYNFQSGALAINTEILPVYHSQLQIPISSAHFTDFVGSPTSPSFAPYLVHGQFPRYGSVVSSSETVTPRAMTNFNDAVNGNLDDMQFNDVMYP